MCVWHSAHSSLLVRLAIDNYSIDWSPSGLIRSRMTFAVSSRQIESFFMGGVNSS